MAFSGSVKKEEDTDDDDNVPHWGMGDDDMTSPSIDRSKLMKVPVEYAYAQSGYATGCPVWYNIKSASSDSSTELEFCTGVVKSALMNDARQLVFKVQTEQGISVMVGENGIAFANTCPVQVKIDQEYIAGDVIRAEPAFNANGNIEAMKYSIIFKLDGNKQKFLQNIQGKRIRYRRPETNNVARVPPMHNIESILSESDSEPSTDSIKVQDPIVPVPQKKRGSNANNKQAISQENDTTEQPASTHHDAEKSEKQSAENTKANSQTNSGEAIPKLNCTAIRKSMTSKVDKQLAVHDFCSRLCLVKTSPQNVAVAVAHDNEVTAYQLWPALKFDSHKDLMDEMRVMNGVKKPAINQLMGKATLEYTQSRLSNPGSKDPKLHGIAYLLGKGGSLVLVPKTMNNDGGGSSVEIDNVTIFDFFSHLLEMEQGQGEGGHCGTEEFQAAFKLALQRMGSSLKMDSVVKSPTNTDQGNTMDTNSVRKTASTVGRASFTPKPVEKTLSQMGKRLGKEDGPGMEVDEIAAAGSLNDLSITDGYSAACSTADTIAGDKPEQPAFEAYKDINPAKGRLLESRAVINHHKEDTLDLPKKDMAHGRSDVLPSKVAELAHAFDSGKNKLSKNQETALMTKAEVGALQVCTGERQQQNSQYCQDSVVERKAPPTVKGKGRSPSNQHLEHYPQAEHPNMTLRALWRQMTKAGWSKRPGSGLVDFYWAHPAAAKLKKKDMMSLCTEGVHYFTTVYDLQKYAVQKLGWAGNQVVEYSPAKSDANSQNHSEIAGRVQKRRRGVKQAAEAKEAAKLSAMKTGEKHQESEMPIQSGHKQVCRPSAQQAKQLKDLTKYKKQANKKLNGSDSFKQTTKLRKYQVEFKEIRENAQRTFPSQLISSDEALSTLVDNFNFRILERDGEEYFCLPNVGLIEDEDSLLGRDYFETTLDMRENLCAFGLPSMLKGSKLSEAQIQGLESWVRCANIAGHCEEPVAIPECVDMKPSTARSILKQLGYTFSINVNSVVLPGVSFHDSTQGIDRFDKLMDLFNHIARFGLAASKPGDDFSESEKEQRLQLEVFIASTATFDVCIRRKCNAPIRKKSLAAKLKKAEMKRECEVGVHYFSTERDIQKYAMENLGWAGDQVAELSLAQSDMPKTSRAKKRKQVNDAVELDVVLNQLKRNRSSTEGSDSQASSSPQQSSPTTEPRTLPRTEKTQELTKASPAKRPAAPKVISGKAFPPTVKKEYHALPDKENVVRDKFKLCQMVLHPSFKKNQLSKSSSATSVVSSMEEDIMDFMTKSIETGSTVDGMTLPSPGFLYICGGPGTGKTTAVTSCSDEMTKWAKCNGYDKPRFCFINMAATSSKCKGDITRATLKKIAKSLDIDGASPLSAFEKQFKNKAIVLVLDEIDIMFKQLGGIAETWFQTLMDWAEDKQMRFSMIGISNCVNDINATRIRELGHGPRELSFPAYKEEDILAILEQRLGKNVVDPKALQLISRRVAASTGDARRALEITSNAVGKCADSLTDDKLDMTVEADDKCMPLVKLPHMMRAIREAMPMRHTDVIGSLPQAAKVILCIAVSLSQVWGPTAEISMSTLKNYCIQATHHSIMDELGVGQIMNLCVMLIDSGLLLTGNSGNFDPHNANSKLKIGVQLDDVEIALEQSLLKEGGFYQGLVNYVKRECPRGGNP